MASLDRQGYFLAIVPSVLTFHPVLFPFVFHFSSALTKLRKAAVIFVTSVRPSVWYLSTATGRIFHERLDLNIFRKSIEKIQVSLKSDKHDGYFTCRPIHFLDHISLSSP